MTISTQTAQPATCSVPEAGQALGISRQSAYQAARTGELPTVKIGRRLLVPRAALDRMLGIENDPSTALALAGALRADLADVFPETSEGPAGNGTSAKLAGVDGRRDEP